MFQPGLYPHQRHGRPARLGQHEMRCRGDVFGAQHLCLADQFALLFRRIVRILEVRAGEARFDQADLDILFAQFLAQRMGKALDAGFSRDIDRRSGALRYRRHRPDQHHVAARRHPVQGRLGCGEVGGEVDRDLILQIVFRRIRERFGRHRRIDHRDIEPAEIGVRRIEKAIHARARRQIDIDAIAFADLADVGERVVDLLRLLAFLIIIWAILRKNVTIR